jgi:hypothetical protein
MTGPHAAALRFRLKCLNRGLFNPTVIRRRAFAGHVTSPKQSGTHWVKYLLSLVLAELYDLPAPEHIRSDAIVGHPKKPPRYPGIPQIVTSHNHAHYPMRAAQAFRLLGLPRFVVLVRDPRAILVSNYEKWNADYRVDFATYLRGDLRGKAYVTDIWEIMRFFNSWGPVAAAHSEAVLVQRYEDILADPEAAFARICGHLGIARATPEVLARAIAGASRAEMAKRPDPSEEHAEKVVNFATRDPAAWFDDAGRAFLRETCRRNLRCDFGYGLIP